MTDETPSKGPTSGTNGRREQGTSSNTVFFAIIALIIIGTAGWYAMTLLGSEPVGVERAKKLAEEFERECFLDLQDQKRCRELVGEHHRDCLFDNIERVEEGEGDDGSDIRHDRDGYLECMRDATGVGKGGDDEGASP
jgi:hypothetical protein